MYFHICSVAVIVASCFNACFILTFCSCICLGRTVGMIFSIAKSKTAIAVTGFFLKEVTFSSGQAKALQIQRQ